MSGYDRLSRLHGIQNSIDAHTAHKWHLIRMKRLCYFDLLVEGAVLGGCTYCGVQAFRASRSAAAIVSQATGSRLVARPAAGFIAMMFLISSVTGLCVYTDLLALRTSKMQLAAEDRAIQYYEKEASKVVNSRWKADPAAREISISQ